MRGCLLLLLTACRSDDEVEGRARALLEAARRAKAPEAPTGPVSLTVENLGVLRVDPGVDPADVSKASAQLRRWMAELNAPPAPLVERQHGGGGPGRHGGLGPPPASPAPPRTATASRSAATTAGPTGTLAPTLTTSRPVARPWQRIRAT